MATEILMPALSPTMEEGTLAKWLVKEGDTVKSGMVIAEIETDKATMEFEAVDEGIVGKILIAEGTAGVKVNTPIAVMVDEGEAVPAASVGKVAAAPVPAPSVTPTASAPAPSAATPVAVAAAGARVFASPLARRIARENGVDLTSVKGSGPHGRIVKADVEGAKPGAAAPVAAAAAASAAPAPAKPAMAAGMAAETVLKMYADRAFTEVPLDGMRRIIAARLTEAKQTIPHFYLRREVRLDALMAFREQLNKGLEARGVKLIGQRFHHQGLCDCLAGSARCQCGLGGRPDPEAEAVGRGSGGGGGGRAVHAGSARRRQEDLVGVVGRDEGSGDAGQDQEAGAA